MRVLLAVLVVASLSSIWPHASASDGEPPLTIIEIPVPPTSLSEQSPAPTVRETPVSTTSVGEPAPTTSLTQPGTRVVEPVLNIGLAGWPWPVKAGLALALGGVAFLSLVSLRRALTARGSGDMPSTTSEPNPVTSAIAASTRGFEAVEYRSGIALAGSAVHARSIGKFSNLEDAIDAARMARSEYDPHVPNPDAWWVVWNLGSQRAAWIAEWNSPGESVIDLRSGRREPYVAQEVLDHHHEDA